MRCMQCGELIVEQNRFCPLCGAEQTVESERSASEPMDGMQGVKPKRKIAVIISLVIILMVMGGFAGQYIISKREIAREMDTANQELSAQNYDKAQSAYNQVLAVDSGNISAMVGIAQCQIYTGNYEGSEKTIAKAKQIGGFTAEQYQLIVKALLLKGQGEPAMALLAEAHDKYQNSELLTDESTGADPINVSGGQRIRLRGSANSHLYAETLSSRLASTGYGQTVIYTDNNEQTVWIDIIGNDANKDEINALITDLPFTLSSVEVIPPHPASKNSPDFITILGGLRTVYRLNNDSGDINEVLEFVQNEYDLAGMQNRSVVYESGNDSIIVDCWLPDEDRKNHIESSDAFKQKCAVMERCTVKGSNQYQ